MKTVKLVSNSKVSIRDESPQVTELIRKLDWKKSIIPPQELIDWCRGQNKKEGVY